VEAFAVIGTPEEAVAEVKRRYGDIATRITLAVPDNADPGRWGPVLDELRSPVAA
jgi:hypothetical protein